MNLVLDTLVFGLAGFDGVKKDMADQNQEREILRFGIDACPNYPSSKVAKKKKVKVRG